MKIIESKDLVCRKIELLKKQNQTIGFVPTMGALHKGHYELLKQAKNENKVVVCSIFVNPTQFNNPEDLKKYPRDLQKDFDYIADVCDLVFVPSVEEMYPENPTDSYDFGYLDTVMEAAFRPGHFNGVAMVVRRLFEIVKPDNTYFGKKDYQQALIVKELIKQMKVPIRMVMVDTVRESDGLAFSSRNSLLSSDKRKQAPFIYQTMQKVQTLMNNMKPQEIEGWIQDQFKEQKDFDLEYATIVQADNLQPIHDFATHTQAVLCVAAYLDNIRLIDNLELNKI
ncbi:MAG: pantoate--beta-alanine ligase [Bacteroidales bacterium]|nr:pantoate--beta-alanine ligase [Bacteroidales bacterium]